MKPFSFKRHPIRLLSFISIAKGALKNWRKKDPVAQSAIIAYYSIFSMPGLMVIIITIAALFYDQATVSTHVYSQIASMLGANTAKQVIDMVTIVGNRGNKTVATAVGLISIILGATGVFSQLQKDFNIIWEVKPKKRKKIMIKLRTRLFSFGLVISIGFLLLVSLTITTVLAALTDKILLHWPNFLMVIFFIVRFLISFSAITVLFALMFKILPDAKIKWSHVWLGSMLTAALFFIGKTLIGFYLSKTNPGSAYGAAGSMVLILLWVSYSSMIVFYGAEFTRAYADHFAEKVAPTEIAVKAPDPEKSPVKPNN